MWNFKRILLAMGGFGVFLTSFGIYAHFMGGIDGLPPLPPSYWPPDASQVVVDLTQPAPHDQVNRKLAQAFGEHADALDRTIKLETSRRGMVMATDKFEILDDGKARLQPLRVAMFGKTHGPDGTPEINTISCDVAILEFDERIATISDMAGRKIVAADLFGNIRLVNNRRTAPQDDDISVFTQGPIHYLASRRQIYTDKDVRVVDLKSKPQPTTITGTGLDITLSEENPPNERTPAQAAAAARRRQSTVSGVDKIRLCSAVEMHLFIDSQSGFMAPSKKAAAASKPAVASAGKKGEATPGKPSHITITTDGPFTYYVTQERAEFDVSGPGAFSNLADYTNWVDVIREHDQHLQDTLKCQHLELQFRRKQPAGATAPPSPGDSAESSLDVETAHATVSGDRELKIHSDAENLEAWGKDLTFNNQTKTTILKGETEQAFPSEATPQPMRAVKDGNVINARELRLVEVDGAQQATGIGPGRIELFDKNAKTPRPVTALWRDTLVSNKEGSFDCLTLTGDAVFDDVEHDQKLRADSLKVWLQPNEHANANSKDGAAPQQRVKPHHVEAKGHVTSESTELRIDESPDHPTELLVIWFKDALPGQLPEIATATAKGKPEELNKTNSGTDKQAAAAAGGEVAKGTPSTSPVGATPQAANASTTPAPGSSKQPIHLNARSIEAYVIRSDTKSDLDRLWCEDDVRVRQQGATPDDEGVDIKGKTLQMTHFIDGNVLVVTGDLAYVQMDKTTILGPEVTINQKENSANVRGNGVMRMPAKSDFNGNALAKPVDMVINWHDSMTFNGRNADFYGKVNARQEHSHLLCDNMHVVLDRAVSFKEGEKGKQPAKIDHVDCDKDVWVEDWIVKDGKRESYKRLQVPYLALDNADGKFMAPGPGVVTILQRGEDGPIGPQAGSSKPPARQPPRQAPAKAGNSKEEPMKLTKVHFKDRLYANNQTRTATFYGEVTLINVPTEDPDLKFDPDHPPPGYLRLTCDGQLQVFSDANKHQQMEARYRVYVQSQGQFHAYCHELKYDEDKEQVILIGSSGNPASLYRVKVQGAEPERITGMKIYYWRKTNDVKVEGGEDIKVNQ